MLNLIYFKDEALETQAKSKLKQIPSHTMLMKKREQGEQERAKNDKLKEISKQRGLSVQDDTGFDE